MISVEHPETQNSSNIVNVHSAAIHIENKVTLIQRQSWLYLLYRAFPTLKEQTIHEIPLNDLKDFLHMRKKDNAPLKQSLKSLVGIILEWNVLEKDSDEWGATGLLAFCKIVTKNGKSVLSYEFSSEIRQKLANPSMYAKINLIISQRFKSKHALSLYCLALDYHRLSSNFGYKHLTLEEMKLYLGVADKSYTTKELKRAVMLPAQKEINESSDIELNITDITSGRKITGFRLEMRIKDRFLPAYQSPEGVPVLAEKTEIVPYNFPELVQKFHEKHAVNTDSKSFKDIFKRIQTIIGDDTDAYFLYMVEKVKKQESAPYINNLAGFYISQLDDDGQMSAFKLQIEKKKSQQSEDKRHFNELLDKQLQMAYQKKDRMLFNEYLANHIEDYAAVMKAFIETSGDDFACKQLRVRYQDEITAETIKNPTISTLLYKSDGKFGYQSLHYEAWKADFTTDKANEETLRTMQQQAWEEIKKIS